ncbi:MAG: DUF262 domain-containing protein [Chloroflexi bacterium]|nr:DUF262 domain-containing protein [Chloroflexota bacterium]
MDLTSDKKRLLDLVERAGTGRLALPQFQRDFVWDRDSIEELIRSLLRGYYIGSFLFLETDRDHLPFGTRPIAGANADGVPEHLVLDGQQRITALHYVFAAPDIPLRGTSYPYRFFIDLSRIQEVEREDDVVWSVRADAVGELDRPEVQYERSILPLTELPRWERWNSGYGVWLANRQGQDALMHWYTNVRPIWDRYITRMREALIPVITLPRVAQDDRDGIAQICSIFEKLNSTGLKLSVFDLLTARLFRDGVDLHALWRDALRQYPLLAQFAGGDSDPETASPDTFGVLLLRTVALLRGREIKSRKLVELAAEDFPRDWERAAAAMERALKRVTSTAPDGLGAVEPRWVPYTTNLPVLAAALAVFEERRAGAEAYATLRRWYWASVFLQRYAGSVESQAQADFQELMAYLFEAGPEPATLREAHERIIDNAGYSLRSVVRQNAVYRGVMNLIALRGARDFAAKDHISFHELDDHHIFPRAFLARQGIEGDLGNTVVNRTLIATSTNQRISRSKPSQYLQEIFPVEGRQEILDSHLIPPAARMAMERDDYEAFLSARDQALVAEVRRVLRGG